MDEKKRYCESCGMMLEDAGVMGTNSDGSVNEEYCVYCYKNGAYTAEVTMEEMIEISLEHMREMYAQDPAFNEREALEMMNGFFPKLKRWRA